MRLARLACVSFIVLGVSSRGEADVLGRVLSIGAQPGGAPATPAPGTQPPAQSADLSAWAGEARATTLPELLQVAVRQAPTLQNARIDIAFAEAVIQATYGRNDWLVAAIVDGSGATDGSSTQITGTADLSRRLPTGGTVDLHAASSYSKQDTGLPAPFDVQKQWRQGVSVSFTQPLLRGRGRALFEANEAKATLARDAAVLAKRLAAVQTVQAVVSAYWDLVLSERSVAITRGSLDLARERLRVTTIGADGGKIPRSEIPAVLQIIATREEDVLNGELGVLNSSIALRRAAGMPIGAGELGLRVATDVDTKDEALDLSKLVERAYTASPELAQLAKQDASATIDVEVTENGLLPQLDLALSLGPAGAAETFTESWKELAKLNALSIGGTLTFTQSLGRNEVKGRLRETREVKRKLAVNALDVRAQIAQTMTRAVAQLEVARRRVTLSQRAIDLANENIKIETDRFNLGKSTNFDVLNRLEDLRRPSCARPRRWSTGTRPRSWCRR